jgi:uncharacterized protein YjbI with pentapeptide repeats
MRDVNITFSDLAGAQFSGANLQGAAFLTCNLKGADLSEADVARAKLYRTQLMNADLRGIMNWQQIASIEGTNIYGVKNAPAGFTEWALAHGAVSHPQALANLHDLASRHFEPKRLREAVDS